ncbi:MAG: SRPBCC family protein [Chitinophagaceae bacterium]|nr:SRPBCC family protein [Chitinophagaceae bacterium]
MATEKPDFVYVLFIKTTPEELFKALLDPEMTKQFWGRTRNVSDWKVGSTWEHQDYDNSSTVDVRGTVVEFEENKKLVLTWANPQDENNQSEVTFEIIPFMGSVQLKVTHKNLSDEARPMVSMGWSAILSSLKSLLETGEPLASTTRRWKG